MKESNYKLKEGFWFGLVKLPILIIVIGIAFLILYSSLRYLNPSYKNGYLTGNQLPYFSVFRFGLIIHLIVAPLLILSSSILLFFKLETKKPKTHRLIGRFTIYLGVAFLIPSGLILSYYAIGGMAGQIIFFILTILTFSALLKALFEAKNKNFNNHRKWVIRFYILLTSAIWLRLNMFFGSYFFSLGGVEFYLLAALLSWVPQLLIAELFFITKRST